MAENTTIKGIFLLVDCLHGPDETTIKIMSTIQKGVQHVPDWWSPATIKSASRKKLGTLYDPTGFG